ncbi:MAG: penicillin-binding protein, partial [Bacteroidota bacterium]
QASRTALPIFGSYTLRVYKDSQFKSIRRASYPDPPEMVQALLECPPYLPEMPIVDFLDGDVDEMVAWSRLIESIDPERLQGLLNEHPRRGNESLGRYAMRIRRIYDRQERRDGRREERKEHWSKILFGKKEDDG